VEVLKSFRSCACGDIAVEIAGIAKADELRRHIGGGHSYLIILHQRCWRLPIHTQNGVLAFHHDVHRRNLPKAPPRGPRKDAAQSAPAKCSATPAAGWVRRRRVHTPLTLLPWRRSNHPPHNWSTDGYPQKRSTARDAGSVRARRPLHSRHSNAQTFTRADMLGAQHHTVLDPCFAVRIIFRNTRAIPCGRFE
jgi:hypothetical protein